MILLEREDVDRLDLWTYPFLVKWDLDDPEQFAEGAKVDWAEIPADGPFLLVVHDENALAGQDASSLYEVAGKRYDIHNKRKWKALADMYAEAMGISRQSMVLRFAAMTRHVRQATGWLDWDEVYHWPQGGDLAWSALMYGYHPWLVVREHGMLRQVGYR